MSTARSGQMLEACLPLGFAVMAVKSRLRGRFAYHLVPCLWCPGRVAAKGHFVVPGPTVARVSVDTHGSCCHRGLCWFQCSVPISQFVFESTTHTVTGPLPGWPGPCWSELSGLPLGSKMLIRSNCWVRPISGTMSQQHPGFVLKSVAQVASRANREAWELGQSLRHGLSLKVTAQQRPYRYGWTAATQGHGIIPA